MYDEEELYDDKIDGIPAFLIFQNPVDNKYKYFTDFKPEKLNKNTQYTLLYYAYTGAYSTKSVTLITSLDLKKIALKRA